MKPILEVQSISKKFKLRHEKKPYLSIRESITGIFKKDVSTSEDFYALKDVSFNVEPGESIGIIGKNGAGKSTLLKILSRITPPSTGKIIVRGRIASLLEVGTGFHPELTGRENIFLNGSILGMKRKEITAKFDEIVDFSGTEQFLDTPLKHFSSGMQLRLAFSVAAFLEPEILVIDEVLSVGDAEFQKKCIGKMENVSKSGRTILFVSHNLASVKQLCTSGILLGKGSVLFSGTSSETVEKYISLTQDNSLNDIFEKKNLVGKDLELTFAEITDTEGKRKSQFEISEDLVFNFTINCLKTIPYATGYIVIKNLQEEVLLETDTQDFLPNSFDELKHGLNLFQVKLDAHILAHGNYTLYLSLASNLPTTFNLDVPGDILNFSIIDSVTKRGHKRTAKTSHLLKWVKRNAVR
jgi:lipopolysaccharide transport system ATP-binding protein